MKKERLLHINKSAKALLLSVITVTMIYGCSLSSVAVLNQGAPSTAYSINPCVVYGLAAAISLAVTAAYSIFNKKKEPRRGHSVRKLSPSAFVISQKDLIVGINQSIRRIT